MTVYARLVDVAIMTTETGVRFTSRPFCFQPQLDQELSHERIRTAVVTPRGPAASMKWDAIVAAIESTKENQAYVLLEADWIKPSDAGGGREGGSASGMEKPRAWPRELTRSRLRCTLLTATT